MREDGSIVSSYVHYDGYETGVGGTLLEHYSSDELAEKVASAGYFSSLSGDMEVSLSDSVHTEKPDEFEGIIEFGEWLLENSHLEFGYLWTDEKWMVSSWTTKVEGIGRFAEYSSTWNGFSELIPAYVREGRKMINRFRDIALEDNRDVAEYDTMADEMEVTVDKWHRVGMGEIAREALSV
jgi:hypothetical protein